MLFLNQNVITPYGKGVYLGPSENPLIIKVQPTNWVMARETKPTFFMNPKDVKPLYVIGSLVSLTYGDGVITGFRESDCMYIVELSNWRLAQGQSPSLYLQESALSLTPNANDGEKDKAEELVPEPPRTSYAETCIANAISIKEEAGIFYKKMDYNSAKDKYLKALEAIQYLGESLSNEQKAIVFEQTVPCHNNISLCCMQLKSYGESAQFAKNGLMLITALEERMKDGLVWQCLLDRGMTKNKLLKEWKIKSYFLAGKAELLKKEYDASISHLEDALKILADDPQSTAEITKLKDLLSTAMKKRSAELKKEKSTWSKAFQKNKEEPEKPEPEVVAAADAPSQGEDMKSIEEILKTMNIKVPSPAGNAPTSATSGAEANGKTAKTAKRSKDIKKDAAAKNSEAEGSDGDSVSDEAFGWLIGATAVIGAIGLAAFFVMKSKQK